MAQNYFCDLSTQTTQKCCIYEFLKLVAHNRKHVLLIYKYATYAA